MKSNLKKFYGSSARSRAAALYRKDLSDEKDIKELRKYPDRSERETDE